MESDKRVTLKLIHDHPMMPWNDLRKGKCCGRFASISDGYFCKICDFFVHKKCVYKTTKIIYHHPSHPNHRALEIRQTEGNGLACDLCGKSIMKLYYGCMACHFFMDLNCVKYPPPEVVDSSEMHPHKLNLLKERIEFDCDAKCGKTGAEFPYKCHECDLTFHVDCVWHPQGALNYSPEVNHSYHSFHPLKLLRGEPPNYSDGKCRLCRGMIESEFFYHCSSCNFTLDLPCVLHPPPQSLLDLKAHEHQLTLLPRLDSFTCNACGLKGDRSPYMCVQCVFMIHQDCLGLPRVININRHDHRISRSIVLGAVNSVCGVCRKKVDWKWGGYSCHKCPGYVVHSKCATRKDVWNGKELEGIPEEEEDIEPYLVIDDNTIRHFSHKKHYLTLHVNGILYEENKRCNACIQPLGLQSFYGCMDCDFTLHQNCAKCPKRKWHMVHNDQLTLVTTETNYFRCDACYNISNGFIYMHEVTTFDKWFLDKREATAFDVLCCSISEPFIHPSHPHDHPLYYIPTDKDEICNGCNLMESHVLRCIEDGCRFVLGFKCAILPLLVKHRVYNHLSLCYGEDEVSGKYWCDICEKETNPKNWFYTCKDHLASLHTECVLGDFSRLMPRNTIKAGDITFEVVVNNSMTRPFCRECESRCINLIILKLLGTSKYTYICSDECRRLFHLRKHREYLMHLRQKLDWQRELDSRFRVRW